jgi:hypothetical protein
MPAQRRSILRRYQGQASDQNRILDQDWKQVRRTVSLLHRHREQAAAGRLLSALRFTP